MLVVMVVVVVVVVCVVVVVAGDGGGESEPFSSFPIYCRLHGRVVNDQSTHSGSMPLCSQPRDASKAFRTFCPTAMPASGSQHFN